MTNLTRRLILAGGAALCALPGQALAHREKATVSTLEWRGDGFAITHRFHRHDAETALSLAGFIDEPEIDSLRSRALIAIHVEETFALDGMELVTLGAETEGNRIWVYQEAKLDTLPEELKIGARMLRNLWADHINNVDVVVDGEVTSLRFSGDDGMKTVTLT